mgnify:CR=1 FL=1
MKANTKIFGCIADPINHVKAPTLFTKMFQKQKINAIMIPINVSKEDIELFFSGIRSIKNFVGITVTIPHKTSVLKYCDYLEKEAIDTQSVNWIKIENKKLIGTNFDGLGFVKGLKNKNLMVENKDFAIFGIGGAGISICYSLIRNKAKRLKLINRNFDKLNIFADKLKELKSNTEILTDNFYEYDISEYDYVINATSLGLKENKNLVFDVKKTKIDCTIIEIVMDPEETILIKEAMKYKRNYHLGKHMLESQVKLAGKFFNLW